MKWEYIFFSILICYLSLFSVYADVDSYVSNLASLHVTVTLSQFTQFLLVTFTVLSCHRPCQSDLLRWTIVHLGPLTINPQHSMTSYRFHISFFANFSFLTFTICLAMSELRGFFYGGSEIFLDERKETNICLFILSPLTCFLLFNQCTLKFLWESGLFFTGF